MANNKMKYEVVKEINITDAMKASGKSASAERSLAKQNGSVWAQTVCTVLDKLDMAVITKDTSKDGIDVITKQVKKILEKAITVSTVIPETGKNRQGKDIQLTNKDGSVKWMSWDQTFRIFAYAGDIAKVLAHDLQDELQPEELKVAARCDILKKCKVEKSALEHIQRLSGDMKQYLEVVEGTDATEAQAELDTLAVKRADKLHTALGTLRQLDIAVAGLDSTQKDAVKDALMSLIQKNF